MENPMLSIGKLLTEEQGRLTVRRVLSVDDGTARVETTYESAGSFGDVHYTDLGTLWSYIRPDGTLFGEWKGGLRTDGNDTAVYRVDLTRFCGPFLFTKRGDQDGQVTTEIYAGVSPPDGCTAPSRTHV
jgi:hypothetical protein